MRSTITIYMMADVADGVYRAGSLAAHMRAIIAIFHAAGAAYGQFLAGGCAASVLGRLLIIPVRHFADRASVNGVMHATRAKPQLFIIVKVHFPILLTGCTVSAIGQCGRNYEQQRGAQQRGKENMEPIFLHGINPPLSMG